MAQSINLIPKEERFEQKKEQAIKLSSYISVGLLAVTLAITGYYWYLTRNVKSQIAAEEQRVESYRRDITNLAEMEVTARTLDSKYQTLNTIYKDKRAYSTLLNELAKRVPAGVTVTSFSLSGENQDVINLSGKGSDYIAIARFINTLTDQNFADANEGLQGLFTNVTLNSVTLDTQGLEVSYFIVVNFEEQKIINGSN